MGVEIAVTGLTKTFGSQTIWQDVTLTLPAGEISVMLGPSGTGKSVFLKTLVGLLKPDDGSIVIDGQRRRHAARARPVRGPQAVRRAVPGRRPVRLDEPLRQHRLPAARAHEEVRGRDQARSSSRRWSSSASGRRGQAARRDLRWHAQARRPGPRAGARPRDPAVRRARLRSRPGAHRVPQPADRRPQRADRRDVPHRHARHQHRAHGARQHRPALPPAPGDVRPARDAAEPARSRSSASSSTPSAWARSACREEKDADELAAEAGQELPPLPPIALQLRTERRVAAPRGSAGRASGAATTASPLRPARSCPTRRASPASAPSRRPRRRPSRPPPRSSQSPPELVGEVS